MHGRAPSSISDIYSEINDFGCSGLPVDKPCGTIAIIGWRGQRVIDEDGFRPNVGIVVANDQGQVLWARRVGGQDAWQFPQGGIKDSESPEEALYRELHEEVGLRQNDVEVVACTTGWLRYRLPRRLRRFNSDPGFKGQKQKWFLLRMLGRDEDVRVDSTAKPEFDH